MGFRGGLCLYQVWWSSFLRYRVEKQTDKQTNKRRWTPYPRVPLSRTEWSLSLLQRLPMLFSGPVNPKIAHSRERISTPPLIMVPWAHASQPPNRISIDLAVFVGLTNVTNRQTHRQTDQATPLRCGLKYIIRHLISCNCSSNYDIIVVDVLPDTQEDVYQPYRRRSILAVRGWAYPKVVCLSVCLSVSYYFASALVVTEFSQLTVSYSESCRIISPP